MVLVSGELYVRAYRGVRSRWYQAAQKHSHGRIRVGAVTRDVLLATRDTMPDYEIDAAYRSKYGQAAGALVASPAAQARRFGSTRRPLYGGTARPAVSRAERSGSRPYLGCAGIGSLGDVKTSHGAGRQAASARRGSRGSRRRRAPRESHVANRNIAVSRRGGPSREPRTPTRSSPLCRLSRQREPCGSLTRAMAGTYPLWTNSVC
ncbi:DUF2255 family protein [Streptomyces cynarae]|uniref:DUF2255 family protein n=1 Tax=Streptomyces cynarae TaxID=2981134 RepID=UPI00406CB92E